MFDRWRQENFFKYLRDEFALDALADYATVPDDPRAKCPTRPGRVSTRNGARRRPNWIGSRPSMVLEALRNLERQRRTMRGFKIAQGQLGRKIREAGNGFSSSRTGATRSRDGFRCSPSPPSPWSS